MAKTKKRVFKVWVGVTLSGVPFFWTCSDDRVTCRRYVKDETDACSIKLHVQPGVFALDPPKPKRKAAK